MSSKRRLRLLRCAWLWVVILMLLAIPPTQPISVAGAAAARLVPAAATADAEILQASPVITIGVAAVLSGPAEQLGWQQVNSVQLAVSQTNAAGGLEIGGITHTVVLVTADDQCDPAQAPAAAQALLDAGAVAVVGHTCSGASAAAQPLYYAAGVAMVSPSSTAPDLTEQGYTTTLRVVARDDAAPIRLANHVYQELGITRTAIVEREGVPLFLGEAFSATLGSLGGTITSRRVVTDTADYTATLAAIKNEDHPGAILYVDPDANAAGFFSHVSADVVGMDDVAIAWAPVWEDDSGLATYVAAAGPAAVDDYAGFPQRRTDDMPGYSDFNKAYFSAGFANYGDDAGMLGAFAYDDSGIILAAVDRADSADPAAIHDAIAAAPPYAGVVGNYAGFDAQGDVLPQWSWIYAFAGPWQPLGGPVFSGGQVNALAVDPTISGTLYAAVQAPGTGWGGGSTLYKSTDGGNQWTALHDTAEAVLSLDSDGGVIYAGTYNRDENPHPLLYRSDDGGQSWEDAWPIADGSISTLATVVGTAIAGGGDHPDKAMLLRTVNAGVTWEEVFSYTLPGAYPAVNAATILPLSPTVWLLSHDGEVGGDWGAYLQRSTDEGLSWLPVYTASEEIVDRLVIDPLSPTTVYASTRQNNLLRSSNGGLTWTAVITDGAAGEHLVVDAAGVLYAARWNEVRVSVDGGDTWTEASSLPGDVQTLALDRGPTPGTVYAGLDEQGIYRSGDGGANWDSCNGGLSTLVVPRDIDVDPQDPARLFAAARCGGGWMSTDGGTSWTQPSGIAGCMDAFAINPEKPGIVYSGENNCNRGTIGRSEDGGLTFAPVFTPTFFMPDCSGGSETIYALAVAPSMSSTVYAAGEDNPDWEGGYAVVVRSFNGGISWTVVITGPGGSHATVLAIDPISDSIVYAGGQLPAGGPGEGFVARTTDGGASWTPVLLTPAAVSTIAIDQQKPNVLYAGADNYEVYKSQDRGDSWTTIRTCCPSGNLLATDPYVPSHVYLGGWGYVAESQDGGRTFGENDPFGLGVPPMEPRSLTVDSGAAEQTFYAGFSGVWFYRRPAPRPGEAAAIQMWTEPPSGTVYANGLEGLFYHGLAVDMHGNWVADGTPLTVTYDLRDLGMGEWTVVKLSSAGHVQGGVFSSTTGVVTFTAAANVRATAWVTGTFLYNAPAAITITGAPVSLTVGGATGLVSATVPGLHDGCASDGTAVAWETSLGTIVTATLTAHCVATTTLTTGDLVGTAVITATTAGFGDTITVEFVGRAYRIYLPLVFR